jgi:hypothetical protein
VGASALNANTTAGRNTAVGYVAGQNNTTGHITAIGAYVLVANTTGTGNTGVGGNDESVSGALQSNTTGNYNIAVGTGALQVNTTGSNNVALGYSSLQENTTASQNTAVGYQEGYSVTTAGPNDYFGYLAGYTNQTGNTNVCIGTISGRYATGSNNTFLGYNSGGAITTGAKNTIIGQYSGNSGGLDIRTASNRIVLSDGDGNPRGVFSNDGELYVGITTKAGGVANAWYQATTTDSKSAIAVSAHVNGANAINWYNASSTYLGSITLNASTVTYGGTSDYRLKENVAPIINALAKVQALKPCTFTWKNSGEDGDGFIAHELQEVCPNAVSGEKDAVNEDGSIRPQQVDTSYVVATLTAAIQELKTIVDAQASEITALKAKVA